MKASVWLSVLVAGTVATTPTDFVTRTASGELELNGNPFPVVGANLYWLGLDENVVGSDGSKVQFPTEFRVDDALATVVEMGGNVVRAHSLGISVGNSKSFEPTLGNFSAANAAHITMAVGKATSVGVKLIIPLTDNWNYYTGGKHTFVDWHGITGLNATSCVLPAAGKLPEAGQCAFYHDPAVIASFKQYVAELLKLINPINGLALKEDPTILAWETGNELVGVPTSWTAEITAFIKSDIQAKQLVMDGRDSVRMGPDPDLGALPDVDIVTGHYYPMKPELVGPDSKFARAHGKAFTVGEFGWNQGDLPSFLSTMASSSAAGWQYWSLFPHADDHGFVEHGDGFSLHYPGDTPDMQQRAQTLRTAAYALRGLQTPPFSPVTVAPTITTTVGGCVAWRGATLAGNYSIEISIDNGTVWNVVCDQCRTDMQGPLQLPNGTATGTLIRARGYSLNGAPGPYSTPVAMQPGTPTLCQSPPPPPGPPPSAACEWQQDTDYNPPSHGCGSDGPCGEVYAATQEECCGACLAVHNCLVGVFQAPTSKCFLKPLGSTPHAKPNVVSCKRK